MQNSHTHFILYRLACAWHEAFRFNKIISENTSSLTQGFNRVCYTHNCVPDEVPAIFSLGIFRESFLSFRRFPLLFSWRYLKTVRNRSV
jgi:hypothetical protein